MKTIEQKIIDNEKAIELVTADLLKIVENLKEIQKDLKIELGKFMD
jgi:hypothetical protein